MSEHERNGDSGYDAKNDAENGRQNGPGTSNPVVWFEVMGQHGEKLRDFYSELLGWRFKIEGPMNYGVVERDEAAPGIAGGVGQAGPGHPSWVTFYTQVPDLDAAIEKARSLGSQVLMSATRLPDTTIAVVSDPEGHPVGLCTAN